MVAMWLSLAFLSTWKIARAWKMTNVLSALVSILWLSMPIVWWHARYSMLSIGIALLPFYYLMSLRLYQIIDNRYNASIRFTALYICTTIIAVFMDGYSFMMFAVGSSILGAYAILRFPENRSALLKFGFPVHVISFTIAYILYAFYIGKTQFAASPLDFFRGWGIDLMFFAVPSKGVHWLWDTFGFSSIRTGHKQFGDASVWATTFAFPTIFFGAVAWWRTRKTSRLATGFLMIAVFGFYMGLGPSIKLNSIKPEGVKSVTMSKKYAVAPTGNSLLSEYIPGFKNMRASYRWSAMGFFGMWLLLVLLLSKEHSSRYRWIKLLFIAFLILSNLPHMKNKFKGDMNNREDFIDIEKSLICDLKIDLIENEKVAFLPYRNDFFVNYLASRTKIRSYNIGGDKNLAEAKKNWPVMMKQFRMAEIDKYFAPRILMLLARNEANAVVLPYIDLLWAAHAWPAPLKFKNEMKPVIKELHESGLVKIDERQFYTVVRLVKKNNPIKLRQIKNKIIQTYCRPPECLEYTGIASAPSLVGTYTGSGMETDGRSGYLMFGPHKPMNPGDYNLQIMGKIKSNGNHAVVDVVYHSARKTYARFEGLGVQEGLAKNILLKKKVTLNEAVPALEVRVWVDKKAALFISSYSFKPITFKK